MVTKQARLDTIYVFGIEHGSQLPFEDGDMARTFDDVDFLVLYLAQAGRLMRVQAVTAWSAWRKPKLNAIRRETLDNNRKGNKVVSELFVLDNSKRHGSECFKLDDQRVMWTLSADGWARVLQLLSVLS